MSKRGSRGSPVDRMTGRDGLRALGSSERGRVLKQHLDILYFNLFFSSADALHIQRFHQPFGI